MGLYDKYISEKKFQDNVIQLARTCQWKIYHPYDSRMSVGAGYPDLTLVKNKVLFVELKRQTGRLTPRQKHWRDALLYAGAHWRLWRPSDWDEIVQELTQ